MFSERLVNVPNRLFAVVHMQVEWSLVSLFILDPRLMCRCGVDLPRAPLTPEPSAPSVIITRIARHLQTNRGFPHTTQPLTVSSFSSSSPRKQDTHHTLSTETWLVNTLMLQVITPRLLYCMCPQVFTCCRASRPRAKPVGLPRRLHAMLRLDSESFQSTLPHVLNLA
jgi:hypothetical protein